MFPNGSDFWSLIETSWERSEASRDNSANTIRMNAIVSALAEIKPSIDVMEYFLGMDETKEIHCFTCTPANLQAGSCGPTCALLNPAATGLIGDAWWADKAADIKRQHERVGEEMQRAGEHASDRKIQRWEGMIEDLKKAIRTRLSRVVESGWDPDEIEKMKRKPEREFRGNIDQDWTFDKAWGTDTAEIEEFAPDDITNSLANLSIAEDAHGTAALLVAKQFNLDDKHSLARLLKAFRRNSV
jgi:hypothetical protein